MKILRFDMRAFGPFTDVTLNLEAGAHGLHLIFGPNEAGKSATLRALRQFFFGIDERTPDAFRHPYERLRIAARIRHSDGSTLECVRRKARSNGLRGADDKSVLDDRELARYLADVDQTLFETMFGIDHKTLVRGGLDIMQGGGHLGQVLFAAGSGIADLRAVQDDLATETANLFRPAGKSQRINKALSDLRETQATVKRRQLSAEEWARHDHDLHAAEQEKARIDGARRQQSRELNRLARIRAALPALARRKELLAAWAECKSTIILPMDFPEKRQRALQSLRVAEDQARGAQIALEQIDLELRGLDVPRDLLDEAARIEDLRRRLGEYQKDMKDRPVRVEQAEKLENEARDILRSLRRPAELGQAENLRLSVHEPLRIQNLGTQQQGVSSRWDAARQALADLKVRARESRERLEGLAPPAEPGDLRRLIRAVQNEGPLEEQWQAAQRKLQVADKQAAIELSRLTLWSGSLEALEKLALPATETLERFEGELAQLESTRGRLQEREDELAAELRALNGRIERLEREQDVPSEEDLRRTRELRSSGWRLVRQAWLEHTGQGQEAGFVAEFAPAGTLAEAYERSVECADLVADRLRREAERVASKAKLLADSGLRRDQLAKCQQQLAETQERLARTGGEWVALWQPLAIAPLSPREMRAWLRKHADLTRQGEALRGQREQAALAGQRIEAHREELGAWLQKLGEAAAGPNEMLSAVLQRSQEVVDRFDEIRRERERLEREHAGYLNELPGAEAHATQAEGDFNSWRTQWAAAMATLGLEGNATPAEANAVLAALAALFQKLHEANGFRRRIEGMDRDAAQFRSDVQEIIRRVARDLASRDVEEAERELQARLQRARAALQTRDNLLKQRAQEGAKFARAQETLARTDGLLAAMCQDAGCAHVDELPAAQERSARRQQVERELRHSEEHLLTLSAGATLEEFSAEAAQVDADNIEPALKTLAAQIADHESTLSRLDQAIGSERTLLAAMNDDVAATRAAEDAQNLLAQLHADVDQYAALRLAATVLQEAIERYRKKNQGTVLARAGELFAALTAGSFATLQVDYDNSGEPHLIGIRGHNHEPVAVGGMSDGSCDQLYLALRLASLETYLASHEPIPFIVDDILLNFDNTRSIAALRALAELSRRTQVIFFTHHEHLIDMARENVAGDLLFTHRLPGLSE